METDRYHPACRLGMLLVALLHWLALGLMIWNDRFPPAVVHETDFRPLDALAWIIRAGTDIL